MTSMAVDGTSVHILELPEWRNSLLKLASVPNCPGVPGGIGMALSPSCHSMVSVLCGQGCACHSPGGAIVRLFSVPSGDRALWFFPIHPGVHSRHLRNPGTCRPAGLIVVSGQGRPLSDFSWLHTTGGQASWLVFRPRLAGPEWPQTHAHRRGWLSWALPASFWVWLFLQPEVAESSGPVWSVQAWGSGQTMQMSVEQRWPAGRGETAEHAPRLPFVSR